MFSASMTFFAQLERKCVTDGRIVYNQILHAQNTLVDLDVSAGIYILHVHDGQKTYIEKVTIN